MTDVPYGRGGSPLQNLILRGHRETRLTALRMTSELDAGPVYDKQPLSLLGSAEEIYQRAACLAADMIENITHHEPTPTPQAGEVTRFPRRRPEQSALPNSLPNLSALHDFIRMLDAEGYPRAFLEQGGFRFEFSRAVLQSDRLAADVTITRLPIPK
jgi:methionyl-tRNA formyltransferase